MIRALFCALACTLCSAALATDYARVEGVTFRSVLPVSGTDDRVTVTPFLLARTPVTNRQYAAFVSRDAQWRHGSVAKLFADDGYLRDWANPGSSATLAPDAPITGVSWFAAVAYCEAQGARLPTWHEWEWAAAADERVADARGDPEWRQRILSWYSRTGGRYPGRVGAGKPNIYGVHDLHGLVWEWVEDFGSMMVSADNREQGDPDLMKFCGTGALTMEQKENYAVLMRIAMLSSLQGRSTTSNLGFRCAKSLQ